MQIEHARRPAKGVTTLMYVGDAEFASGNTGKAVKIGLALALAYFLYRVGSRGGR